MTNFVSDCVGNLQPGVFVYIARPVRLTHACNLSQPKSRTVAAVLAADVVPAGKFDANKSLKKVKDWRDENNY